MLEQPSERLHHANYKSKYCFNLFLPSHCSVKGKIIDSDSLKYVGETENEKKNVEYLKYVFVFSADIKKTKLAKRNSRAKMEFLITKGWNILIILVLLRKVHIAMKQGVKLFLMYKV